LRQNRVDTFPDTPVGRLALSGRWVAMISTTPNAGPMPRPDPVIEPYSGLDVLTRVRGALGAADAPLAPPPRMTGRAQPGHRPAVSWPCAASRAGAAAKGTRRGRTHAASRAPGPGCGHEP
jgi:hypothetical protein